MSSRPLRTWLVLSGAAALLLGSLGGAEGAEGAEPEPQAGPNVRIMKLEFRRAANCRWSWVAYVANTGPDKVMVTTSGSAIPSMPSYDAGRRSATIAPGPAAQMQFPAYVFAWPNSARNLLVKVDASHDTAAGVVAVDQRSIPIALPPIPTVELNPPKLTALGDGTASVSVAMSVAGAAPATLYGSEVRVNLCHSTVQPYAWTCATVPKLSGMMMSAGCSGGQTFATAQAVVPEKTIGIRVVVTLTGTSRPVAAKEFKVSVP